MAQDEFSTRFAAAKSIRTELLEKDGRQVYKYCFNGRECEWDGVGSKKHSDPEEIFASDVAEFAEDFYGELFHTMFPESQSWVEYETGIAVEQDEEVTVKEIIEKREAAIDKSISDSNFYQEGPTSFQDCVLGNAGMWIDRYHISSSITCEAISASKTYVRLGPRGLEDRFRKEKYYYRDLTALFPEAKFPKAINDKIDGRGKADVIWGFWRDYKDVGNPIWRQEIRVDNKPIGMDADLGEEGSCPFIIGRFNPQPNSPFGRGPGRRLLPDIQVYDELLEMNLENMDQNLDPAYVYPHDGILDLSEGIEAGMAYPAMPGSTDGIRSIGTDGNWDYGFFTEERIVNKLKSGFYRENEQRGLTPPSASQYVGDEQKQIRRIARPSGGLWVEFGVGVLKRFEWLEAQPGGSLQGGPPLLNEKVITLRPISPLERAQAREEVLVAQSIMGMTNEALGPQEAALMIDGSKTMTNVKDKMKDKLVAFRSNDQIDQLRDRISGGTNEQQGNPPQGT